MPEAEKLATFAATGATLVIHLAIHAIETVVDELTPFYGADCPAAVVVQASSPAQRILRGTLADIAAKVAAAADRAHGAHPGRPRARRAKIFATARSMTPIIAAGFVEAPRERTKRLERRAADQILLAIEQHDLDGDVAAGDDARRRLLRRARDRVAQRDVFGSRQRKSFRRGIGAS